MSTLLAWSWWLRRGLCAEGAGCWSLVERHVRGAGAVAVDDRGQPLHVGAQHLGERLPLGLAQLRELLGDVRHRAVMLAELYAVDRPAHRGGGGGVAGLGQCVGDPIDSGFNVVGSLGYSRQDGVDAAPREGADGVVAADFAELTHRRDRQVVVGVAQLGAARGGQPVALGGPAAAAVLPRRGGTGLRIAGLEQRVEVPAHARGGDAEPVADLACGDGSGLQQELDDRATRVAVVPDVADTRLRMSPTQRLRPPDGISQHHCDGIPKRGKARVPLARRAAISAAATLL